MFFMRLFSDPYWFICIALLVTFSVCFHEFTHALTALLCGDPTAADRGHLTLNPLKQMGAWSIIMFLLIGLAWGSVPVNPSRMRSKYAPVLVALSGPLSNLFLALLFAAATYGSIRLKNDFTSAVFYYGSTINIVLAIINILPLPGLDGWQALRPFWEKHSFESSEFIKGVFLFVTMALLISINYLYIAASAAVTFLLRMFHAICGGGAV